MRFKKFQNLFRPEFKVEGDEQFDRSEFIEALILLAHFKYDKELVNVISRYFECSKLQTKDYLEIMDKEQLKEILELYGIETKRIRKMIK